MEQTVLLGTLDTGNEVIYTPSGADSVDPEWTTRRGVSLERYDKADEENDLYQVVDPETGEEVDHVVVKPGAWGSPERDRAEIVSVLDDDYGWATWTAKGLVIVYGDSAPLREHPSKSPTGGDLVGLVKAVRHLSVPLYRDGESLVPYAYDADADTLIAFPEGDDLTDDLTVDLDEYGGLEACIRALEADNRWSTDGYPHELTENRIVTGQTVEVAEPYSDHLRYPSYYRDGGQKHRIR